MNDYYCAFYNDTRPKPAPIGYGDWKIFKEDLVDRIKRMTDEHIKEVCGVNPNILSPDHKFDKQVEKSMKDWGKQTYAKDEGEVPFTLERLHKMWKVIEKQKKCQLLGIDYGKDYTCKVYGHREGDELFIEKVEYIKNKKRRRKLKILILEGIHAKGKKQWRLKRTNLKVGDRVVLDCHDYRIIKVVEEKKPITLVLKDEEARRIFYKRVKHTGMIVGMTYLIKGRWVKVLEIINKSKKKPKGVIFSEFANTPYRWDLPYKEMLELLIKPNIVLCYHRKAGRNLGYQIAKEYMEKSKREAERKALSEFHKRPYFEVVVEEIKGNSQGKENLEKIKFPCYCEYSLGGMYKRFIGEINKGWDRGMGNTFYLSSLNGQGEYSSVTQNANLKELMRLFKIEILKGEVKVWKEVGEYTKKKE